MTDNRSRSPLKSSLKKTSSTDSCGEAGAESQDDTPVIQRRDSRVSIGHVDIEEVAVLQEDRALQYIVAPDTIEERIVVTLVRKEEATTPAVARGVFGWECTWGLKDELTIARFTELVTEAYEAFLEQQRADWTRQRSNMLTSIQQEPKTLVKEGSFKILSVTMSGEELDAWDEVPIDLPDGSLVICHADVKKYNTQGGLCVVCCVVQ